MDAGPFLLFLSANVWYKARLHGEKGRELEVIGITRTQLVWADGISNLHLVSESELYINEFSAEEARTVIWLS